MIIELAKAIDSDASIEKSINQLEEDIILRKIARDFLCKLQEVQSA